VIFNKIAKNTEGAKFFKTKPFPMKKRFEYKTLKIEEKVDFWTGSEIDAQKLEAQLNQLGLEGWEQTSAIETNYREGKTNEVILLFKREIG
jgi:hypothetical protein